MTTARITSVIGLLLFWPVSSWAHALSPTYVPLGHVPIYLGTDWWPYFVMIPFSVAVTALVLWACMRDTTLLGHLWRATILYIVGRVAETTMIFLFEAVPFFRSAGWSSATIENFGPLALCLAVGLAVALSVGWLLYRRANAKVARLAAAVTTASLAAYVSTFGFGLALAFIEYKVIEYKV